MGTMAINPLLVKLSIPMMVSMLVRHFIMSWTPSLSLTSAKVR